MKKKTTKLTHLYTDPEKNLIMSKQNARIGRTTKKSSYKIYPDLVEKSISLVRQDIQKWRMARMAAMNVEEPSRWRLYNIYETDIMLDSLVTSQIGNRIEATIGANFNFIDTNGNVDEQLTNQYQNSILFNEIIKQIINTRFYGHSLIELNWNVDKLNVILIPRQNVIPSQGKVLFDYTDPEGKSVMYRELPEYGTYLLEFGENNDLGILNKAVGLNSLKFMEFHPGFTKQIPKILVRLTVVKK